MAESAEFPMDAASESQFREMRDRLRGMFDHALAECSIPRAFSRRLELDRRYLKVDRELYDLAAFSRALVICDWESWPQHG